MFNEDTLEDIDTFEILLSIVGIENQVSVADKTLPIGANFECCSSSRHET